MIWDARSGPTRLVVGRKWSCTVSECAIGGSGMVKAPEDTTASLEQSPKHSVLAPVPRIGCAGSRRGRCRRRKARYSRIIRSAVVGGELHPRRCGEPARA